MSSAGGDYLTNIATVSGTIMSAIAVVEDR